MNLPFSFNKLPKHLTQPTSRWWNSTVIACLCILSAGVYLQGKFFFTGDSATNGLILEDVAHGRFYSWFFYGQNYFGNLEHVFLAPLTLIISNSVPSLYLLTNLEFAAAVWLILESLKLNRWLSAALAFVLFFPGRLYEFTIVPQGWSFILLITALYFWMFTVIQLAGQIHAWQFFTVGLFAGLSLWHNLYYLFILPVFTWLVWHQHKARRFEYSRKHLIYGLGGLLLGLVPFALATLSIGFLNLDYLPANTKTDLPQTAGFILRDLFYYYVRNETSLLTPVNLLGFLLVLCLIPVVILGLRHFKPEYTIAALFAGITFVMPFFKTYPPDTLPNQFLRYLFPFYVYLMAFVFLIIQDRLRFQNYNWRKFLSGLTVVLLIVLNTGRMINLYQMPRQTWIYEIMLRDLRDKYQAKFVQCDVYFPVCSTIAYNSQGTDLLILINNSNRWSMFDRNPYATELFKTRFDPHKDKLFYIRDKAYIPKDERTRDLTALECYRQDYLPGEYCILV